MVEKLAENKVKIFKILNITGKLSYILLFFYFYPINPCKMRINRIRLLLSISFCGKGLEAIDRTQ